MVPGPRDVLEGGEGEGEGEGSEEGGGGFGWDPPPPRVPLWSPPKGGRKSLSLNPLVTEGAKADILAVSLKHWKWRRGGPGGGGYLLRCTAVLIHHCPGPQQVWARMDTWRIPIRALRQSLKSGTGPPPWPTHVMPLPNAWSLPSTSGVRRAAPAQSISERAVRLERTLHCPPPPPHIACQRGGRPRGQERGRQ